MGNYETCFGTEETRIGAGKSGVGEKKSCLWRRKPAWVSKIFASVTPKLALSGRNLTV